MEVYADDMLVKTQNEEMLLSDLTQVFNTIDNMACDSIP